MDMEPTKRARDGINVLDDIYRCPGLGVDLIPRDGFESLKLPAPEEAVA